MTEATAPKLFSMISQMEDDILHSQWLSTAVRHLGQTNAEIPPEALYALGCALLERIEGVRAQWDDVQSMAAELRNLSRQSD